ncbi:MAG: CBS domain-containing protein [Acidobacteria bacterium]|nr:CBS domain-containing protein [Acidobacteriota bacterium]
MVITAGDLLKTKGSEILFISPEAQVYEALQLMAERNVGALLVLESGNLVGIFSERDYARKLVLKGKFSKETRVREVMTEEVVTVEPSDNIERCMAAMTNKRVRHLPVLDRGRLLGVISIGDIVKAIISEQQSTIGILEDYITGGR